MDSKEIIEYYATKHSNDEGFCKGSALHKHIPYIAILVQDFNLKSILDYGCGKAEFWKTYSQWKAMFCWDKGKNNEYDMWLYDPGIQEGEEVRRSLRINNHLPPGRFDMVVCTDVLEHVPEADVPSTLYEIVSKSRRFVYLNISCYPATKRFPDGTNLHLTIKPQSWWRDQIEQAQERVFKNSKTHINIITKFDEEK